MAWFKLRSPSKGEVKVVAVVSLINAVLMALAGLPWHAVAALVLAAGMWTLSKSR